MKESESQALAAADGRSAWTGHLLMLLFTLFGSFTFLAIKYAARELSAVSQYLLRLDIAAVIVLLIWLFRRPKGLVRSWKLFGFLLLIAFLRAPLYQIALNFGIRGCNVGMTSILVATMPLHVAWMGHFFLGERFGGKQAAAVGLAFFGAVFPALMSFDSHFEGWPYLLAIVSVAITGALIVVTVRKMRSHLSAFDLTAVTMVVAAIMCLPMHNAEMVRHWRTLDAGTWGAVIYLAVVAMFVLSWLQFAALRRLTALGVSLYQFAAVILTILWGCIFLAEPFEWPVVLAVVLVGAGLTLNSDQATSALRRMFRREAGVEVAGVAE